MPVADDLRRGESFEGPRPLTGWKDPDRRSDRLKQLSQAFRKLGRGCRTFHLAHALHGECFPIRTRRLVARMEMPHVSIQPGKPCQIGNALWGERTRRVDFVLADFVENV